MKRKLVKVAVAPLLVAAITFTVPEMLPVQDNISVVEAASVKISAKKLTLIKGQSKTLKISGTKSKVTWSSSKKSVATVSSKGKVTAKRAGTATITAKVGKKKYTCKVTVEAPKLNKTSLSLKVKKTYKLKVSGTKQKVKWSVGNKSIATVNSSGVVTAKKAGSTRVIATVGGKKYTCVVKVSKGTVAVTKVKLNKSSLTLDEGKTYRLKATVSPSNATNKTVKWTSSKKSVATVDSKGNVKAVAPGKATITAKSGSKSAKCTVTVEAVEKVPSCVSEQTVYTRGFTGGFQQPTCYVFIKNLDANATITNLKCSNSNITPSKRSDMDAIQIWPEQTYPFTDLSGQTVLLSFSVNQNGKTYDLSCKLNIELMPSPFTSFKIGSVEVKDRFYGNDNVSIGLWPYDFDIPSGNDTTLQLKLKGKQKVSVAMTSDYVLDSIHVHYNNEGRTEQIENGGIVDFDKFDVFSSIAVTYHTAKKPVNYKDPVGWYGVIESPLHEWAKVTNTVFYN